MPPGEEAAFVAGLELRAIPGVGPKLSEALRRRGLIRVADALGMEREELQSWLGSRTGSWLYDRMRGVAGSQVVGRAEAKSLSHETTFDSDINDDDELERILIRLTTAVCRDIRRAGFRARTVTLKLRDEDFRTRNASRTLPSAVSTDRPVSQVVIELLHKLRRARRVPVRLLGVALSQLTAAEGPDQLSFFAEEAGPETERDRKLASTVDRIRQRYGHDAIRPGRLVTRERDPPPTQNT